MSACLSPRDRALLGASPVEPVLHDAPLRPLSPGQRRFVCAANGLYAEARSDALHLRCLVGAGPTPYGQADEFVVPAAGPVPLALVSQFVAAARATPQQEIAGVIVREGAGYALRVLGPISASGEHVSYSDRDVDDDALVIDLHSHGAHAAVFSSQDDRSDLSRRGPYIAMVVGRCFSERPEIAARLVMPPYLQPATLAGLKLAGALSCE